MKPHIQRAHNLHEWVCLFPDEPYNVSRRGYGETVVKAYQSLLEKMRVEAFGRYCLPVKGKASAPLPVELQGHEVPFPPPSPTSETHPLPVPMTDGLHRRVKKMLGIFQHQGYKQNR